jgi:soluble lytic murein transglycosylase-like protein
VRVVFRREPRIIPQALRIVGCETGHTWNEREVNGSSGAAGLAQFLRSTWRNLPRRYSRHSVFHPVWNIRGMRYLRLHDGDFHQWVCR